MLRARTLFVFVVAQGTFVVAARGTHVVVVVVVVVVAHGTLGVVVAARGTLVVVVRGTLVVVVAQGTLVVVVAQGTLGVVVVVLLLHRVLLVLLLLLLHGQDLKAPAKSKSVTCQYNFCVHLGNTKYSQNVTCICKNVLSVNHILLECPITIVILEKWV